MIGYYRGFCSDFSSVVTPLTNLLKQSHAFLWTPECQSAFEKVKALLTSAPFLVVPQMNKPFKLQVDSSHAGAGAVLLQDTDQGDEQPVCYSRSRKFSAYQINYSTIEKEALALIWALQNFEVYLGGCQVPIIPQ